MLETLTTDRLVLRPVEIGDVDFMARLFGDPEVMAHIGMGVQTPEEARRMMFVRAGTYALLGLGNWVVCMRKSGAKVGEFGFFDAGRGASHGVPDAVEAGWAFLPEVWGRGIASEASAEAHGWFDRHRPGVECFALISVANPASLRVARKCGYVEGSRVDHQGRENLLMRRAHLSTRPALG